LVFSLLITTVYATNPILEAETIKYDNSESGSNSTNVQGAIDELFENSTNSENTSCLNVAVPKLSSELIPVTIADDGTVTMVDSNSSDWYDYCNRIWANAVILIDNPSKTYSIGDTIEESDIESYFVWIPKYKYKLWNVDSTTTDIIGYRTIDIIFDTKDTKDIEGVSCKTPMTSGETGNCSNGEYMTHPAFISLGVDGFWVGKFETSNSTLSFTSEDDKIETDNLLIKPNEYSWTYISLYNAFMNGYNYKTDLNSHMMKNTEWGAVAYLSHSEYGINTEININNNSDGITGYSSVNVQSDYPGTYGTDTSVTNAYNTVIGYKASTTGNISGIYDMSGGFQEYLAAYVKDNLGNSGFTADTISNEAYSIYFDEYSSKSTLTSYNYRILGDATGEIAPFTEYADSDGISKYHNSWYADVGYFLNPSYSWITRGGDFYYGALAGSFHFDSYTGEPYVYISFRIVLSP
jgi:hypothetical protein